MAVVVADGRRKTILFLDVDEDALLIAENRAEWWALEYRKRHGRRPTAVGRRRVFRREYRKIVKDRVPGRILARSRG